MLRENIKDKKFEIEKNYFVVKNKKFIIVS